MMQKRTGRKPALFIFFIVYWGRFGVLPPERGCTPFISEVRGLGVFGRVRKRVTVSVKGVLL